MIRNIVIGGTAAAVILGAGGAALAASGTVGGSSADHATTTSSQHGKKQHKQKKGRRLFRHLDHATIVEHTKKHGDVTHQLIRGTVSAVSPTSISVVSADKTTDTFSVTKQTHVRKDRKPSSISDVHTGDTVFVGGVGASDPVARHVLDRGTK